MRRFHLARLLAAAAPRADPVRVLVVLVNVVRAVAVANVNAAVRGEGDIGRPVRTLLLIDTRLLGKAPRPDHVALEGRLDHLSIVDVAEVKEFLTALFANINAVSAVVVLLAKGADKFAGRVEHDDGIDRRLF